MNFTAQEQGWMEMWYFLQGRRANSKKDVSHPFKGVGLISDIADGCLLPGGGGGGRKVSYSYPRLKTTQLAESGTLADHLLNQRRCKISTASLANYIQTTIIVRSRPGTNHDVSTDPDQP